LGERAEPFDLHLEVELTDRNIDAFETRSCEDLFADMESRGRADIAKLPDWHELASRYTESSNRRAYGRFEVARLWVDRFLQQSELDFDAKLLHEHVGVYGSRRVPKLV